MARLTPQQLQEARRQKEAERQEAFEEQQHKHREAEEQKRAAEEARQKALAPLRERLTHLEGTEEQRNRLHSALNGFYQEIDKLAKTARAHAEPITELQMKRANELIRRGKELMQGDEFVDEVSVFVPAGQNPPYCDVLVELRALLQGVQRLEQEQTTLGRRLAREDGDTDGRSYDLLRAMTE